MLPQIRGDAGWSSCPDLRPPGYAQECSGRGNRGCWEKGRGRGMEGSGRRCHPATAQGQGPFGPVHSDGKRCCQGPFSVPVSDFFPRHLPPKVGPVLQRQAQK